MPARPAHRAPAPRFTPAVPRDPAAPDHRWPLRSYLELAALYTAPGCARAHARAVLWEWGADAGLAETIELLLSEMMTNAVKSVQEHGCPYPVRLWMLADGGSVLLLVWDATMPAPVPRVTTPDAEHGRGLTLVDALSRQWGYYHPAARPGGEQSAGKVVWALVEPDAPAPRAVHRLDRPRPEQGTPAVFDTLRRSSRTPSPSAIGVSMVQFIGGEPTLSPDLPRLVRYALSAGLKVWVYSNLVHVTPELWELFSQPGVSLGTSWYSADADTHAKITGSRASHARTAANIAEAVARGIFVRAAIVEVTEGQDTEQAAGYLRGLGVTDIRIRPQQDLGRAARDGNAHDAAELCGLCGENRAAIMADGQLTPCVVGRWLDSGNVKTTALADIFAGPAWQRNLAIVPRRDPGASAPNDCPPASDGNDCPPASCQ